MAKLPLLLLLAVTTAPRLSAGADGAGERYTAAFEQERAVRQAAATVKELRAVIAAYEAIVLHYPRSGYSDNALWQASGLALDAFRRYGQERDRQTGIRVLRRIMQEYPASPFLRRARDRRRQFQTSVANASIHSDNAATSGRAPAPRVYDDGERSVSDPEPARPPREAPSSTRSSAAAIPQPNTIRDVSRTPLADGVRVTIRIDAEVAYHEERLANPQRVFFDFKGVRAAPRLADATLTYNGDIVRRVRLGTRPNNTTRVVLDLDRVGSYSVFALYNPYRLVIDCVRAPDFLSRTASQTSLSFGSIPSHSGVPASLSAAGGIEPPSPVERNADLMDARGARFPATHIESEELPLASSPAEPGLVPAAPSVNSNGKFSLARQLGLGVARIVIDPGHGGYDPGAQGSRLSEAELVLDVALRLEKLLLKQPGFQVVMTRRADVFVPLEERTAIANREDADLFLSIHANASRNSKLRGVETYFLNFASGPDAEAVAARENAGSAQTMRNLPEIVRAIALNNKLDESRDFAGMVQQAMVSRLRSHAKDIRNLGVKQAPFVVLVGASMPSVLAEISFVSNSADAQLLRNGKYRQRIAEALINGVVRYQHALKSVDRVAKQ